MKREIANGVYLKKIKIGEYGEFDFLYSVTDEGLALEVSYVKKNKPIQWGKDEKNIFKYREERKFVMMQENYQFDRTLRNLSSITYGAALNVRGIKEKEKSELEG